MTKKINLFANLKSDFASGLVVFLVALPLCLGIAMASGAPLFSGIIAGVVGGIVIGCLSKSHLSVSGPAAGLTSIMLGAMSGLGTFELVLTAGLVAGTLQLLLGFLRAGSISNYIPTNVIEGMLAGIGIVIILKQLPHAVGYDREYEGAESFFEVDGSNTFSSLLGALNYIQLGAVIITVVSIAVMLGWGKIKSQKLRMIPGALIAVLIGVGINQIFAAIGSPLEITGKHLVNLPVPTSFDEFKAVLATPDLAGLYNLDVLLTGATIAVVASIETVGSSRVDLQACKLEYSIVSPK